jgi:hypothetical protein
LYLISLALFPWVLTLVACESGTRPNAADAHGVADVQVVDAALAAVNRALKFSTSYVHVPDHNLLDLTNTGTLEAWVKPVDASIGTDQDIISKWAGISTASYILQIDATGKLRLVTANGTSVRVILSNGTLGNQTWHHVAATFSNGTVKLYVNGALDRTVSGVLTPLISTEPVAFGREGTHPGGTFDGIIDEIRIWNVVRSGPQIARFLTRRLQGSETGLAGYWRLDQGAGQVAADATGHGLNGRLGQTTGADAWDPAWTTTGAPVY